MGLFNSNRNQDAQPASQRLQSRYDSARHNLLLIVVFTTINLILLATNSNTYFLFSAFIPYAIVDLAMFLCGKYPAEYYGDITEYEFLDTSVLAVMLVIAVVLVVLYLLSWLLSKKGRVGWLIFALVFFALDTLLMLLGGIEMGMILDIVFHGWVIISLTGGIIAHFKLKKLPPEETVPDSQPEVPVLPEEQT